MNSKLSLFILFLLPLLSFGQESKDSSVDTSTLTAVDYFERGSEQFALGEYFDAIYDFSEAIRLNPAFEEAYSAKGYTFFQLGQFTQAVDYCTKAIEINPDFAEAYSNRGIAYGGLKDYNSAISDFSEAIRIDPGFALAYSNRAFAKFQLGMPFCSDIYYACALGLEPQCDYYNSACK